MERSKSALIIAFRLKNLIFQMIAKKSMFKQNEHIKNK